MTINERLATAYRTLADRMDKHPLINLTADIHVYVSVVEEEVHATLFVAEDPEATPPWLKTEGL
jgi:hypothetical protein